MATIPAERLREDQTVIVRGHISYSRLAKLIDGAELVRSIESARKRGSLYPTDKPHTTISLVDARVVPLTPGSPTLEEQYTAEKLYQVKSGDNAGKTGFSIDDKSPNLPPVFEPIPAEEQDGAGSHRQVILEQDLDSGLDVTLVLRTFQSGSYTKKGLGIQQVILNEPLRYYNSASIDTAALSALGITIAGPVQRVSGAEAASRVPDAPVQDEGPLPEGTQMVDGLALPGPVASAPAPAAFQQPVAQAAPVAEDPAAEIARLKAQIAAGAPPVETPEQELARLRAQVAGQQAATPAGQSPFDVDPGPGIGFGA